MMILASGLGTSTRSNVRSSLLPQHGHRCSGACQKMQKLPQVQSQTHQKTLHPITAVYHLQLVHMDYLTTESPKSDKDIIILVITNHFVCCAQVIVISLQTTIDTAQALWSQCIVHLWFP